MAKRYEDLTFSDDFLICKILEQEPELCRKLLELILDRKLGKIVYVNREKPIEITADGRGVRFDVYAEDNENTIYDVEKIFLCTSGGKDDISQSMRSILNYVAGGKAENDFTNELDKVVTETRFHKNWRQEYMTLLEHYEIEREEGRAQGLAEGLHDGIIVGVIKTMRKFGKDEAEIIQYLMAEYQLAEEDAKAFLYETK